MIDLTTIGVIAVAIWSFIQERRINRMCEKCPFLPSNAKKKASLELKQNEKNKISS